MAKPFRDLTEEEKQKRYEYNRQRRARIMAAAEAGGYTPEPRAVLSEEERAERQAMHHKRRRKAMEAAYRRLREQGYSPAEADEELEEMAENIQYIQGPATYLGSDYQPGMFGSSRRRRR
jgi:hypothetical protein